MLNRDELIATYNEVLEGEAFEDARELQDTLYGVTKFLQARDEVTSFVMQIHELPDDQEILVIDVWFDDEMEQIVASLQ